MDLQTVSESDVDSETIIKDDADFIPDLVDGTESTVGSLAKSRSPQEYALPGARRVTPIRNDSDHESDTSGFEPSLPVVPLIEATVVGQIGANDIENMLAQAREEGRESAEVARGPVLEGEIVDSETAKGKKRWTIAAIAVFVVSAMIGISFGVSIALSRPRSEQQPRSAASPPSQQPVTSLVDNLLEFLETLPYVPVPLSYSAAVSAEDKALVWLADEDPLVPSLMQNGDFERLKQRFALLSFAYSNPSYPFESIEDEDDECLWPYIVCSNETHRVVGIETENNRLLGSLPESLGLLTEIRKLNLFRSNVQGTLPTSLSLLTFLEYFDVGDGGLTGPFPWSLFQNMSALTMLSIEYNFFSGTLPKSLDLRKIKDAILFSNMFTGTLPSELSSWTSLELFDVDYTLLSGSIPSDYGAWTAIKAFYAAQTNLSGSLPESLGNWHQIDHFVVSHTNLSGEIPNTYSSWRNLTFGSFEGTRLSGSMPLCDLNLTFDDLIADCLNVSCPCCTECCPTSVGQIPQSQYCELL